MSLRNGVPPVLAQCPVCKSNDGIETQNVTHMVRQPGKAPRRVIVGALRQCTHCSELYVVTGTDVYSAPRHMQPWKPPPGNRAEERETIGTRIWGDEPNLIEPPDMED